MRDEPIAIVGRGCVLPGTTDPDHFWDNVAARQLSLAPAPPDRWPSPRSRVLGTGDDNVDRAWTDVGGFVSGFDSVFDPSGFAVDAETITALDPVFRWTLHAARAALREASPEGPPPRAGLVMGNLSYPSAALVRYAEHVWLADATAATRAALLAGASRPHPANRFSSGYPALFAARALGLNGGGFAVDAACASALYAIKLACDRLREGSAELMLAGGVNAAEIMFLHIGFTALGALSRTGRCRPFDRDADGLVPAEGAAFFALMRLRDAVAASAPIHGVIRGLGLSNDGRAGGFLTPVKAAQIAAMRSAYAAAQVDPSSVSLVECHAAGTPTGDAVEIASMAEVFADCPDLPIGSIKSNVGHLLTAAGAAGLLKVLGAMRTETLPATLGVERSRDELAGTPLRPLREPEKWLGRRRAAISAFGFGGNNAHLIVDAWEPGFTGIAVSWPNAGTGVEHQSPGTDDIAIVAVGARVGSGRDRYDFEDDLLSGRPNCGPCSDIAVALGGLRFPPTDLTQMAAQQVLALEAAREAVTGITLPPERTIVLIGMGSDPEVARYHARWLSAALVDAESQPGLGDRVRICDAFAPALSASAVVGTMPNIVANRINTQSDLKGLSYGVSAEEESGLVALDIAARAIRAGEADAAIVGAVDLSHEPVHRTALAGIGIDRQSGDAAVVLVLKRLSDARRDGAPVIALLEQDTSRDADLVVGDEPAGAAPTPHVDPVALFGSPHAASGVLAVAIAAVALRHRVVPQVGAAAKPLPHARTADVVVPVLGRAPARVRLRAGDPTDTAGQQPKPDRGTCVTVPAHPPRPALAAGRALQREPATAHPVSAGITRTTEQHRQFVARQGEVHRRFLDVAARAQSTMPSSARQGATPTLAAPLRRVVTFDRDQLLRHASGGLSELFGPRFRGQDGYRRRTRLPEPPLLLVDRVTSLEAEPMSMGTGIIRTETDVRLDGWYLDPAGRMPAGILVEAGQADLLLISWLGVDLVNRGERAYRLLGCELTFHGSLPRPGDTLRYTISVDGHHEGGGARLFSFHSAAEVDGQPCLSVRGGVAGFFTEDSLASSGGVLWDPLEESPRDDGPMEPPSVRCPRGYFDADAVRAFAEARAVDCFGDAWTMACAHVRSPRIPSGRMLLLGKVTECVFDGGPWGRGYLRAETPVRPDDWFFTGHFRDDPCMPGTLMLEGCLQAMAFYLAAAGCTIDRDGWRFEPVPEQPWSLRCRGQVTPQSRRIVYEVFVSGFSAGPRPTLYADVLCTADGLKVFHARRVGLRLVPAWPLDHWRALGPPAVQHTGELVPLHTLGGLAGQRDVTAAENDGVRLDYATMLECAWGQGASRLGSVYAGVDEARRFARLPGPPYLFVSRIRAFGGRPGKLDKGPWLEAEYDVPSQAWFFDANGSATMPIAALVEVALQPCGALSACLGSALGTDIDLFFRNLDGDFTLGAQVRPGTRSVRTRATLRTVSRFDQVLIESFDVTCHAEGTLVLAGSATFGYFPDSAFTTQLGLPPSDAERAAVAEPGEFGVDLSGRPARYCGGPLRLPGPMLLMLDRITGFWPHGGCAGLGRLRAEKDVDPAEWYFKAHFFGDPVQPGSLGLEAICQLLQFFCVETGLGSGIANPRFEAMMPDQRMRWTFRGQVLPTDGMITIEADITEVGRDKRGRFVRAQAWLWVDGRRIYHAPDIGVRVVRGPADDNSPAIAGHLLDPTVDTWIADHRPNWVTPTLPMMSTVDLLAGAAADLTGREVGELFDVRLRRWLSVTDPVRLRTTAKRAGEGIAVSLQVWRESSARHLSRFQSVATATVRLGTPECAPEPFAPLADAEEVADPYEAGELFHGPAFVYLTSLRIGADGSTGVVDVGRGSVPRGCLHQGLLDALTHLIPHQRLWRWTGAAGGDRVSFPHRIPVLRLYRPLPDTGQLRGEARFRGYDGEDEQYPVFDLQLCQGDDVLVELRLVTVLLPIGQLSRVPPVLRRAFLRDREYTEGVGISRTEGAETVMTAGELTRVNWLAETVAAVYGLPDDIPLQQQMARVAIADHVARKARVHPSQVITAGDLASAWVAGHAAQTYQINVIDQGDRVVVRGA